MYSRGSLPRCGELSRGTAEDHLVSRTLPTSMFHLYTWTAIPYTFTQSQSRSWVMEYHYDSTTRIGSNRLQFLSSDSECVDADVIMRGLLARTSRPRVSQGTQVRPRCNPLRHSSDLRSAPVPSNPLPAPRNSSVVIRTEFRASYLSGFLSGLCPVMSPSLLLVRYRNRNASRPCIPAPLLHCMTSLSQQCCDITPAGLQSVEQCTTIKPPHIS